MTKSASEVREELKERRRKKGGGKDNWLKVKDGDVIYIRIGPPKHKDGEIWKDVYFHGGFKRKVYCAQNDKDEETGKHKKCLIEKRLAELKSDRSKRGRKLWTLINQRSEGLWNVLVAKVKKSHGGYKVRKYVDEKFKVLRLSFKWHNELLDIFADEDYRNKSILGVAHPKYGRLIRMTREGSGRDDTRYKFKVMEDVTPISEDKHERHKLLKTLVDLDELVHGSSKDEIESFLHRMEKKAKKLAKEDSESKDESSDSDEDSSSSDESESKSKSDESSSSDESESKSKSESSSESDDLEKQYKKMKKELKDRKKKHDESES